MSNENRLKLTIDVFDFTNQPALVLPDLTPTQLVDAILQEFQELEYIGGSPKDYRLLKADNRQPLVDGQPLAKQVGNGAHLIISEKTPASLPAAGKGLAAPEVNIYLKELDSGQVFKINWLPAIIGRASKNQANNTVAVDLSSFETGLYVSRRHARIIGAGDRFFIESLSSHNPTKLKDEHDRVQIVTTERQPLSPGSIIVLERSNISLKFIVRPRAQSEK